MGTRRTIVLAFGYQFAAVLIVAGIFWIYQNSDWTWAAALSTETDVGFAAGMMASFSVATATVRPPWRLRLRLAIWACVLFSLLFIGQMADAEHLVAVALNLPLSTRLAGQRALRARALPARHEVRLLVFILVLLSAVLQLIAVVLPARLTLPQLEFEGKKWQDIRTALNKAPKEGIEFRMVTLADQPWALVNQVQTLSEEWLGDKKLPEMGFTLGGLTEALDPEVKVGLTTDQAGVVQG